MKFQMGLFAVLFAILAAACTEVTQVVEPSPVDVNITTLDSKPTEPTSPAPVPTGAITLEPASIKVAVGNNVNVKVVVKDSNGQEVPSENISVNIIDKSILGLVEIDGRIIAFEGNCAWRYICHLNGIRSPNVACRYGGSVSS